MSAPAELGRITVVLHCDYGGFNLSSEAVQHLESQGVGKCTCERYADNCPCDCINTIRRDDPRLLSTVDTLGLDKCGTHLSLVHLDFPKELPPEAIRAAYTVNEYDGWESVDFQSGSVLEWMLEHDFVKSVEHAKQVVAWAKQCTVKFDD